MLKNVLYRSLVLIVVLSALSNGLFVQCVIGSDVAISHSLNSVEYVLLPSSHHAHVKQGEYGAHTHCGEENAQNTCEHESIPCSDLSVSSDYLLQVNHTSVNDILMVTSTYDSLFYCQLVYCLNPTEAAVAPMERDLDLDADVAIHIPSTIILI